MPCTPVRSRLPNVGLAAAVRIGGAVAHDVRASTRAPSRARRGSRTRTAAAPCSSRTAAPRQTIMALEVQTPWPSSVCAMRIVTVSSGAIDDPGVDFGRRGLLGTRRRRARERVLRARLAAASRSRARRRPCAAAAARNSRRLKLASVTTSSLIAALAFDQHSRRPGGSPCGRGDSVLQRQALVTCRVDVGVGGARAACCSSASALMIMPDWQ